jgi:CheY-like chemotaxis protein
MLVAGLSEEAIVEGASGIDEAMRCVRAARPDVIVLDLALEGAPARTLDGAEFIVRLRAQGLPVPPVVVVSAIFGADVAAAAIGAAAFFAKPVDLELLVRKVLELSAGSAR